MKTGWEIAAAQHKGRSPYGPSPNPALFNSSLYLHNLFCQIKIILGRKLEVLSSFCGSRRICIIYRYEDKLFFFFFFRLKVQQQSGISGFDSPKHVFWNCFVSFERYSWHYFVKKNYFGGKDYVNFMLLLEMDKTLKLYMRIFHSETACDFNAYIPLRKEKCSKNACKSAVSKICLQRWYLSAVQFPELISVHSIAAGADLAFYRVHRREPLESKCGSYKAQGHLLYKNQC